MSVQPLRSHDANDLALPPWHEVEQAAAVSVDLAERAVAAMEISRARHIDEHLPAARHIAAAADDLGRPDLAMRARLIVADHAARHGAQLEASSEIQDISDWATHVGDAYIEARCSFLQCSVQYALSDLPAARRSGVTAVESLPADAPGSIRVDHLMMLADAYGPGPDADQCYRTALGIAMQSGDVDTSIGIHNNLAYFAWQACDLPTAAYHVEQMLALARRRGSPLRALALDTVGRVYIACGRSNEAVDILEPALTDGSPSLQPITIGVLHVEPYALPECLLTLAEAHRTLGNLDDAQRFIDRAKTLAYDRGLGQVGAQVLRAQAGLSAARHDWRAAYQQHIAFHDESIRLHAAEQQARARAIQAGYDADEKRRGTVRFRELAMRDPLTGLYNRRFIDEQLRALTAQSTSSRSPLSAAIADADFFKRINDEFSHDVGDRVLQSVAALLAGAVVAPETVGRLGGEEFVILMPHVSGADAIARCEQIRSAVADFDWTALVGATPVTVSIGVTTAVDGQTSPAAILSDADRNLYSAKRSGRNKVVSDPA